jgi:hypothetical protein
MLGCELCYASLPIIRDMIDKVTEVDFLLHDSRHLNVLGTVDGDIVQAVTAVQKTLFDSNGARELCGSERKPLEELLGSLTACKTKWEKAGRPFPFERGLTSLDELLSPSDSNGSSNSTPSLRVLKKKEDWPPAGIETFELQGVQLPRIFCGLWQLSSPAWGSASQSDIIQQFLQHVHSGLCAFDMADHYGDAEILFVCPAFVKMSLRLTRSGPISFFI